MATKKKSSTGAGKPKKVTSPHSRPTQEEIRKKAEEIYHERLSKGMHGTSTEDWLKAEKLLNSPKK